MEKPVENTVVSDKQIHNDVMGMIIPVSIEGILQMIASTVIMAMLGRIDVLGVNAMGVGTRVTQLLWAFARGMSIGITVCVARDIGAKKTEHVKGTAVMGMLSLILIVLICSILMGVFAAPIVEIFGGTADMIADSIQYMKIIVIGLPFWTVSLCTAGIMQGQGDAKTPMKITVLYNILNIGFGYVLMFGAFSIEGMGLFGAAYGTVTSQILISLVCLVVLYKKGILTNLMQDVFGDMNRAFGQLFRLYKIGIPSSMESMLWQLGSIAMMAPIISFGEYPFATHQMAMQAESISYMPTMGFSIATTSLVGRCFGAADPELGKRYFSRISKYMMGITVVIIGVMIIFPAQLMAILTDDPQIIALGSVYLRITSCTLIPQNLQGLFSGVLKAAGYTNYPMIIAFVGLWLIRVPGTFLSAYVLPNSTIIYVWIFMSIDLVSRFLLAFYIYRKKKLFGDKNVATVAEGT